MELDCIRHGVTRWNVENRFNGHSPGGLTQEQARELASHHFNSLRYDRIYCSPLRRCVETAECLRIEGYVEDARLAERNLGVFERLTVAECRERYPREFERFRLLDDDFVIPGGESRAQHLERTLAWLEDASRYESVLAVTHGGTIDFLYRLGSGLPLHGGDKVYAGDNAALSRFRVTGPEVELIMSSVPIGEISDDS